MLSLITRKEAMISNKELEDKIKCSPEVEYVKVTGDGYHYQLLVVSKVFEGKSKLARQQWVYRLLNQYITEGALHAITMQTYTNEEWGKHHG